MTSALAPTADFWDALGGGGTTDVTHELVWVSGSDAVSFTDSLLSQGIDAMAPGTVRRSLLLAPNGKLRALLWVLRGDDEVGIASDVGSARDVLADLTRFKLRVDAVIDPESLPLYSVIGPAAASLGEGWTRSGDEVSIRADLGGVARRLTTKAPSGLALLSVELAEGLRIEAGEPRMGVDVDESTIPQESGLVASAVDFEKGCYLGQELVARIDSRGHVNRRLVAVELGEGPPPVGAAVEAGGQPVGSITSVAWSPTLGTYLGLGLIRREATDGCQVDVTWEGSTIGGVIRRIAND